MEENYSLYVLNYESEIYDKIKDYIMKYKAYLIHKTREYIYLIAAEDVLKNLIVAFNLFLVSKRNLVSKQNWKTEIWKEVDLFEFKLKEPSREDLANYTFRDIENYLARFKDLAKTLLASKDEKALYCLKKNLADNINLAKYLL